MLLFKWFSENILLKSFIITTFVKRKLINRIRKYVQTFNITQ